MASKRRNRPTFKYVKTPCEMADLKVGDICSIEPHGTEDQGYVNWDDLFIVESPPEPASGIHGDHGTHEVRVSRLMKDPDWSSS